MYLKNSKTGEVFCYNERLAAKPGFVKVATLEAAAKDESKEVVEAAVKAAAAKQSRGRK